MIAACCICVPCLAFAADSDSHAVTVQVNAINELALSGGNITLTVNTATAGQEPDAAMDLTTCDLVWTTNESTKKITIETDLGAPQFSLLALAMNVTGGTAAPVVTVSTTAQDFVTGVTETVGSCDLGVGVIATAAQGTGTDVHTITYTLIGA